MSNAAHAGSKASSSALDQPRVIHLANDSQWADMKEFFETDNPGFRLSRVVVDGETTLSADQEGMKVYWIYQGTGEVFLAKGYRTQEGDGQPLPAEYQPEVLAPALAATLQLLKDGASTITPAAYAAVGAILRRWKNGKYIGDFAGELWKLDHVPQPWSTDERIVAGLKTLFQSYREPGWSIKQVDSWEPLLAGDQLIAAGKDSIKVRGHFKCLAMENANRTSSHVSAVRRLRYLADTAGGCNPDFDPFRRLPLTWFYNYPGETGDGLNWVNSHIVNIPKETSPSHFHPPKAVGGGSGIPQREMYLVLDPKDYQLNTWGRKASIILFPDLRDLSHYEQHELEPGMFVYIPPGTGHRGLDVFVNVLTIPGFKPHNEYYIDRDICDSTGGKAPFNEKLLGSKNFADIEELLLK